MTRIDTHRWYEAVWHAAIAGALLIVPSRLLTAEPFWTLRGVTALLVIGLFVAYVTTVVSAYLLHRLTGQARPLLLLSFGGVALSILYVIVLSLPEPDFSRRVLLSGLALFATGVLVPVFAAWTWRQRILGMGIGAAVVTAATVVALLVASRNDEDAASLVSTIQTSRHTLRAVYHSDFLPPEAAPPVRGGAITGDPDGDGYILVRARGGVFRLSIGPDDELIAEDLSLQVPINGKEFEKDNGDTAATGNLRIADVVAVRERGATRIYVSHHYWNRDEQCFVVRVSGHALPAPGASAGERRSEWNTVFQSTPCLSVVQGRGQFFAGLQIGGRLLDMGAGKLLLTVGDHQFDGWYKPTNLVSDPAADYGKTVVIDTHTDTVSHFTYGHRNPQGLVRDAAGRIWSTEHGPQGGDELNLLEEGSHYGYPYHTYGTHYGSVDWPPGMAAEARETTRPAFAWVPSIGISSLVAVTDPSFSRWLDDLLITSLGAQSLWRAKLEGNRVVYVEPIHIGRRLRDISMRGDGDIVLWSDSETLIHLRPIQQIDDGAALFALRCGGCHSWSGHRIGPRLARLFARPIASAKGFDYSPGLSQLAGRWTEKKLDDFLRDPTGYAPGTTMSTAGVVDDEERDKIVAYLLALGSE